MQQIPVTGDSRTLAFCSFCGGGTGTRDHCPSKVFLEEPYPENLPIVQSCLDCNNGFSADEEYLACLIPCVLAGTTDPEQIYHAKAERILREKPNLRERIERSKTMESGRVVFNPESERVQSVLLKLAKGHCLYELHELRTDSPDEIIIRPLSLLSPEQLQYFENPEAAAVWPEIGSRAMQRLLVADDGQPYSDWIEVQDGRYRYSAVLGNGIEVRIVIHEYLACFVRWAN